MGIKTVQKSNLGMLSYQIHSRIRLILLITFQKFQRVSNSTVTLNVAAYSKTNSKRQVGYWLAICGGMVFGAVILGMVILYYNSLKIILNQILEITKTK